MEDLSDLTYKLLLHNLKNSSGGGGSGDVYANVEKNAGAHNSIYRGKDITDLFYDGTLSTQIANGTFDDIFIGDYIIGKESNNKYIVAHINYFLGTGDTELTTPHVLMIPEKVLDSYQMNGTVSTTGAYLNSAMRTSENSNLNAVKTTIISDFGNDHILEHKEALASTVSGNYESAFTWTDCSIELMSEIMVYGSNIFHNCENGTNLPTGNVTTATTQFALFKLDNSFIPAKNKQNARSYWWLRDVGISSSFCLVGDVGTAGLAGANNLAGIRPEFLIY